MIFSKRTKKRLLCILMVISLVLTGCSGGGDPTAEGEDEVSKDQYEFIVMNQYGQIVPGANIEIGNATYRTSNMGTAKLDKPERGSYMISVKCDNYYTYAGTYHIGDESIGHITLKATALGAHRLQSAIFKRGLGSVNLVDSYQKVNKGTAGWKFSIEAAVCGSPSTVAMYKLFQKAGRKEKEIASSANGIFNDISINDFAVGTGVYITVYGTDGNSISTSLRFEIAENPNYTQYNQISMGSDFKLTVSDSVPLLGGTEVKIGFPSMPLEYKVSEDKIHIGFNVDKDTLDDDAKFKKFKKLLDQVEEAEDNAANLRKALKELKDKQKEKGVMGMAGFKKGIEVTSTGYAEAGLNSDGTLSSGTGYLCVTAKASANFDWQYVVWVIPVTVGVTGKVEAKLADTITYDFKENKFKGDGSLTIKPSLEVDAGVGFKHLNGGVFGSAELETKLIIASLTEERGFKYINLTSSVGIYAKLANYELKNSLAKGTFHLWTRDEKKSAKAVKKASDSITDFSDLYELKNYKLSKKADKIQTKALSKKDKTVLASGVSPAAEPLSVSNGKDALNVYTVSENVAGTGYTAPKLYYQTFTVDGKKGSWSEASKINQSGNEYSAVVSEMNPKLYTDGKDYYMAYQESPADVETLKKLDSASTDDEKENIFKSIWKNVELHVKKYDTEKNQWIDYGKINTDGAFDYNADIVIKDGQIYVCSAANAEGDYFATSTDKNYINISSCAINDFSETKNWTVKKAAENLNSVTSLAAGIRNGKITCAYSVDSDNDFATDEQEVRLYEDSDNGKDSSVCTGSAVSVDYGYKNDGKESFTIASNNIISCLKDDSTVLDIVDDMGSYDGIYSITDKGIYYTKNTENGTELFARYKASDGTYGQAVQVTEEKRWLRNVSAFTIADKDYITASSDKYDTEGDAGVTESEIDAFEVKDYYDLNVEEAGYDLDASLTGQEFPVTLKLKNDGNKKITYVKVNVTDTKGKEVAQKTKYYQVDIEPGNEKDVVLNLSGIDTTEFGDWKVSANIVATIQNEPEPTVSDSMLISSAPEETAAVTETPAIDKEPQVIEEKTTDNNSTKLSMGNSDFVVRTQMCDSGNYPYMLIEVKNEGNRKDSATLNLYNANDETKSYGKRNISNLEPGSAKTFKVNAKQDWVDDNGKIAVLTQVKDAKNEMYTYNNYSYDYVTVNYGTFSINYVMNGGLNVPSNPEQYTTAQKVVLKEPIRDDYTFDGWYTSPEFDVSSKISEIVSGNAGDITVYAKWKQKTSEDSDNKPTATPDSTAKVTKQPSQPTKTPDTTGKPTAKPGNNSNSGGSSNSGSKVKLLKKGVVKKLVKYNVYVKVTKPGKAAKNKITGGEVQYIKPIKNKASITIPDTVKIGKYSYKVRSVANNALKNKKALKKVIIGRNVTTIGKNVFAGCKKLKNITVKSTVLKSVGKNALKGIAKNTVIKVPKSKYKKYKKIFSKKTGFTKKMKLKK